MIVCRHVRVCIGVHVPVYSFLTCLLSANAFSLIVLCFEWISEVFSQ